jgi:hypothetical protein
MQSEQVKTGQKSWSWLRRPQRSDARLCRYEKSIKPCRSAYSGTSKMIDCEQNSCRREPMIFPGVAFMHGRCCTASIPRQPTRRRVPTKISTTNSDVCYHLLLVVEIAYKAISSSEYASRPKETGHLTCQVRRPPIRAL